MKISGSVTVPHPVEAVWDAMLAPDVLVQAIPGCTRLEETGEHSYAMTVTAGVAAIKGTYDGTAVLSELQPGTSLVMRLTGAGAPGTIDATVRVSLATAGSGTEVSYDADAVVGGMVGGVGQRMLTSVSKRMAAEFFTRLGELISGPRGPGERARMPASYVDAPAGAVPPGDAVPAVFYGGRRQRAQDDFLSGIAVGAGLVLLGVVAGRWLGRGNDR